MHLWYVGLVVLPNILNPWKLASNLRHPIHEVLHTKHRQYPAEGYPGLYVVEHEFFGRVVTIDIVETKPELSDLGDLVGLVLPKDLFRRDFYVGHADYFPERFWEDDLVMPQFWLHRRFYVGKHEFSLEEELSRAYLNKRTDKKSQDQSE